MQEITSSFAAEDLRRRGSILLHRNTVGSWARAATAAAALLATSATTASLPVDATNDPSPTLGARACAECRWDATAVNALLAEISAAQGEGLDVSVYDAADLRDTIDDVGPSAALDARADATALKLARDYLLGQVDEPSRQSWYIKRNDDRPSDLEKGLKTALAAGTVRPWLRTLLPNDARYIALRSAYERMPAADLVGRERVRANLERWRWMPRDLGSDHIFVNVPSYSLNVVDAGVPVSSYVVVVGAPSTPTPQMSAQARSVVVNPSWNVPASIIRSSNMREGKPGFVTTNRGGALSFSQPPGPRNALGRIKIDMPNPDAIYLHDTQAKSLFERRSRAFSHGCIRVKDIERLAAELVVRDAGDPSRVTAALKGYRTTPLALHTARPVYIVYFTVEAGADGKLVWHDDPYRRDTRLSSALASLRGKGEGSLA